MKTRIISALVAIPIFVWIVLYSPTIVYVGFWFLTLAMAGYEFSKLIPFSSKNKFYIFNLINLLFLALPFLLAILQLEIPIMVMFVAFPLTAILWLILIPILLYRYSKTQTISKLSYYLILFFWLSLSLAFETVILTTQAFSFSNSFSLFKLVLLLILVCVWAADGGAYFVGKFYGKHKFSPTISPNKTWEGFFGGFISSLLLAVIFYISFDNHNLFLIIMFLLSAAITIIYAALGDLFQSMLKRAAGVKDSGNIIPGHGGVFDRIDSWLSALIIFPFLFLLFVGLYDYITESDYLIKMLFISAKLNLF